MRLVAVTRPKCCLLQRVLVPEWSERLPASPLRKRRTQVHELCVFFFVLAFRLRKLSTSVSNSLHAVPPATSCPDHDHNRPATGPPMSVAATRRLQRELRLVHREPSWGVSAAPLEEDPG